MKISLYQEVFETTSFPVFAADPNGILIYKNRATGKYLPMLRKRAAVKRHFLKNTAEDGSIIRILGATPYPNALPISDADGTLYLCFSRLQYPDHEAAIESILNVFGRTPEAFLCTYKAKQYHTERTGEAIPDRIYTDFLRIFRAETAFSGFQTYHLGQIAEDLFFKLSHSFRALGFHIGAEINDAFTAKNLVHINIFDFFFWTGRLLYLAMKLAKKKTIFVSLTSDAVQEHHILKISFRNGQTEAIPDDLTALFAKAAPECAAEIAIMKNTGVHIENTRIETAPNGELIIAYHIPYLAEISPLSVRSAVSTEAYSVLYTHILVNMRKMLKENSSSC